MTAEVDGDGSSPVTKQTDVAQEPQSAADARTAVRTPEDPPAEAFHPASSSKHDLKESIVELLRQSVEEVAKSMRKSNMDEDEGSTTEHNTGKEAHARSCPPICKAEVRECSTLSDFQSLKAGEEGCFAIEALVGGEDLQAGLRREDHGTSMDKEPFKKRNRKAHSQDGGQPWVQRVRINSGHIMDMLASLSPFDISWGKRPHIFLYPFNYLLHFHEDAKQRLVDMKRAVGDDILTNTGNSTETKLTSPIMRRRTTELVFEYEKDPKAAAAAIAELEAYVDFIDQRLLPRSSKLRGREASERPEKVYFEDLITFFRPGDLIYAPSPKRSGVTAAGAVDSRTDGYHYIWKILECWHPFDEDGLGIVCYMLDHDGSKYSGVERRFLVKRFEGEKEVLKLPLYPLQYVQGWEKLYNDGVTFGRRFVDLLKTEQRHFQYSGWTLTKAPDGERLDDEKRSPEHIESKILIDIEEAFNANPTWQPSTFEWREVKGEFFSDVQDRKLEEFDEKGSVVNTFEDRIAVDEAVRLLESNEVVSKALWHAAERGADPNFAEEDYVLLPRRMFAYAIWERKFVQIDVQLISAIQQESTTERGEAPDTFAQLQVSESHKNLIECLVKSHFEAKDHQSLGANSLSQDLIAGKGKGVVILLHGAPGVGKTATAEAVAERFNKPLFPITCGDLGLTADKVESTLRDIFRLAHQWDCILLLDEAETFITQRHGGDIQRNALVSTFLRTLEYYNGILFLTTNRPGVLDEAVKSRVHLNLFYPRLDWSRVEGIFKLNIDRLIQIEAERARASPDYVRLRVDRDNILQFARKHFYRSKDGFGRWNGRQIRNAFLIAAAVAHFEWEKHKNDDISKQLDSKHFAEVEEFTLQYDEYRQSVMKHDDRSLARARGERDDRFGESDDADHLHQDDRGIQGSSGQTFSSYGRSDRRRQ